MMDVKTYDFFAEGKEDFYKKFTHNSILCQGKHWEKPPFVTILITTYRRPKLLRQALESALNQKGFDDYQVIIADNEGVSTEIETPTARVIKDYQNDKVIYYRHSQEIIYRADSAVRLARSPWIVFLHDDDMLSEDHLSTMTCVIKKHTEIKYLSCVLKGFTSDCEIHRDRQRIYNYKIIKFLKDTTCLGDWAGWLGALISRKHYIAIGGMPRLPLGIGDQVMVAKFLHHFGTYKCIIEKPLYFYRQGIQQSVYAHKDKMEVHRIDEYYFYKYVINKYHKLTHKIWERNAAYVTLGVCEKYRNSKLYHSKVDIERIILECNMPSDIKKKNIQYYMTKLFIDCYRNCVRCINYFYTVKLKKTDVSIGV